MMKVGDKRRRRVNSGDFMKGVLKKREVMKNNPSSKLDQITNRISRTISNTSLLERMSSMDPLEDKTLMALNTTVTPMKHLGKKSKIQQLKEEHSNTMLSGSPLQCHSPIVTAFSTPPSKPTHIGRSKHAVGFTTQHLPKTPCPRSSMWLKSPHTSSSTGTNSTSLDKADLSSVTSSSPYPYKRKNSLTNMKLLISSPDVKNDDKYFDFTMEFKFLEEIGRGSFSIVNHAKSIKSGKDYAVKKSLSQFYSKKHRNLCVQEITTYLKVKRPCPNILQYLRAWQEDGYFYLQTEFCEKGNLKEYYIESLNSTVSETILWSWLHSLCVGLYQIHAENIVHADIKTENIFVTKNNVLKIGDFGIATEAGTRPLNSDGDGRYMPYERMENGYISHFSSDVYSLGMVMYELASGIEPPRIGTAWQNFRKDKIDPIKGRSEELNSVIRSMLSSVPTKRPSIYTLLQHPIIRDSGSVPSSLILEPPKTPVPNYNDYSITDKLAFNYTPNTMNRREGEEGLNTSSSPSQSPSSTFKTSTCGKLDFRE